MIGKISCERAVTADVDPMMVKDWLKESGVPVDMWGRVIDGKKTKTIDHLLKEIQEGSSSLVWQEGEWVRLVQMIENDQVDWGEERDVVRQVVVLSGGYNKYDRESVGMSVLYRYKDEVLKRVNGGEQVVFVGLAKPVDKADYEERLREWAPEEVEYVDDRNSQDVVWGEYDMVVLLGGDPERLKAKLDETDFELKHLKDGVKLVGDSAGAFVLASWFYGEGEMDQGRVDFFEGFNPDLGVIVVGHANNPRYCPDWLIGKVEKFAEKKGLRVVELEENEEFVVGM